MSYAVVQDVAASWEHYAVFASALEGARPRGLVLHAAGPTDEGFRTIDLWETEADWLRFRADRLDAVSLRLPLPPITRSLELEHVIVGTFADPAPAINHDQRRSP